MLNIIFMFIIIINNIKNKKGKDKFTQFALNKFANQIMSSNDLQIVWLY